MNIVLKVLIVLVKNYYQIMIQTMLLKYLLKY